MSNRVEWSSATIEDIKTLFTRNSFKTSSYFFVKWFSVLDFWEKHKIKLVIIQTNDEIKAATILQRQRNKICSSLLFPGPWQQSGFVLKNTMELLKIPYITISLGENVALLKGIDNIEGDILKACETALEQLTQLIELN